jgi:hypothetical protein
MGTVNRVGRLALVSILAGATLAACGSPAPTSSFQTKQITSLAGFGWGAGGAWLDGTVAAAVSEIQPVTTNIVGTAPWLGFPGPAALASGLASPWPTFAGNIGTAAMLNAQMGYWLGLGPLGVPGCYGGLGACTLGLASPAGILGYAGLPFVGPWSNLPPVYGGVPGALPGYGGPAAIAPPMAPPVAAQPPAEQQPAQPPAQQPAQPPAQQPAPPVGQGMAPNR